jgi:para-nitrobenzyl esterase
MTKRPPHSGSADISGNRRQFLAVGALVPAAIAAGCTTQSSLVSPEKGAGASGTLARPTVPLFETPSDLVVETDKGRVRGFISSGIRTFKGIPYGASTAGKARFLPGRPADSWTHTRDAFSFGDTCPQYKPFGGVRMGFLLNMRYGAASEDCLNLNVWTPDVSAGKRPVMVWIHGGSFRSGSSYEIDATDGESLSRRGDVVVVSVNHRLNALGHLDLGALGAPSEYQSSCNAGIMDLVLALEWIRKNISEFGGDPDNVTMFGQSGGGMKISTLFGTPAAKGLFHKAILQSGITPKLLDTSMTAPLARGVLDELDLTANDIGRLQEVPMHLLMAAIQKSEAHWRSEAPAGKMTVMRGWSPRQEDASITHQPFSEQAAEISGDIAMMAGSTLHEFNLSLFQSSAEDMTLDAVRETMVSVFADPDAVLAEAQTLYPEEKPVGLHGIVFAATLRKAAVESAQAKERFGGRPSYIYQFSWNTPVLDETPRSYHCSEIPMVFANAERAAHATGGGADALNLETQLADAWIAFARTGSPHHPALPEWPSISQASVPTMIFDSSPAVGVDHDKSLLELV